MLYYYIDYSIRWLVWGTHALVCSLSPFSLPPELQANQNPSRRGSLCVLCTVSNCVQVRQPRVPTIEWLTAAVVLYSTLWAMFVVCTAVCTVCCVCAVCVGCAVLGALLFSYHLISHDAVRGHLTGFNNSDWSGGRKQKNKNKKREKKNELRTLNPREICARFSCIHSYSCHNIRSSAHQFLREIRLKKTVSCLYVGWSRCAAFKTKQKQRYIALLVWVFFALRLLPQAADLMRPLGATKKKRFPNLAAFLTRVGGGKPLSQLEHGMHPGGSPLTTPQKQQTTRQTKKKSVYR